VSEAKTNVLLIAIDTLRADHLGSHGYPRVVSPHLDRIAAEGVVFEDHFAPHIPTHPGFTTLFTGMDAFSHQRVRLGGDVLPRPEIKTLAQLLQEAGYRTAAVDNLPEWFRQGFELYETYKWPWEMRPGAAWRRAELVNERALPLIDQLAAESAEGRPFFLFLHYWDPHTPYLPPPPYARLFYGGNEKDPAHLDGTHSMRGPFEFDVFSEYFKAWIEPDVADSRFVSAEYDACIAYVDAALQHVWQRRPRWWPSPRITARCSTTTRAGSTTTVSTTPMCACRSSCAGRARCPQAPGCGVSWATRTRRRRFWSTWGSALSLHTSAWTGGRPCRSSAAAERGACATACTSPRTRGCASAPGGRGSGS
jgi:hypothetical protein